VSLRVAVLYGGVTAEREVSLDSGTAVARGLRDAGHEVTEHDVQDPLAILSDDAIRGADAVFPVLHGGWGEDGRIQAVLDLAGVPYVGSGPAASAAAMDKIWSKQICRAAGIPTPDWREIAPDDPDARVLERAEGLGYPLVFKPVFEGSAVGVHIPDSPEALRGALAEAGTRGQAWMLESYVPGRELTVPWLWDEAYPVIEIRPREGFYDYEHKYTRGASEYDCPADLPADLRARVADLGHRLCVALRLRDMARVDVRMDPAGMPFVLEANTIPGMTAVSLLPMGAEARGIDFPSMCDRLARVAAARRRPQ